MPDLSALQNLQTLDLRSNQLTSVPDLSALQNLERLYLSHNQLTSVPNTLAQLSHRCVIDLESNPITPVAAQAFQAVVTQVRENNPQQGPRWYVTINEAESIESTLDLTLQKWGVLTNEKGTQDEFTEDSYSLLQKITNGRQQASLNTFLNKLQRTQDFLNPNTQVNTILLMHQMLVNASINEAFREKFFALLENATSSCEDRVAEYLGDLEIQYRMVCQSQAPLEETARLLIGVERLEKVRVFALAKAREKHLGDSIEVMLYCKLKLKGSLQLPISTEGMRYPGMASISDQELAQAEKKILAETKTREQWVEILTSRDLWKDRLMKEYSNVFSPIKEGYEKQLDELEELPDKTAEEANRKLSQQIEATSNYNNIVNHQVRIITEKLVSSKWVNR